MPRSYVFHAQGLQRSVDVIPCPTSPGKVLIDSGVIQIHKVGTGTVGFLTRNKNSTQGLFELNVMFELDYTLPLPQFTPLAYADSYKRWV